MNNLLSDWKNCGFKLLKCILVSKEDIRDCLPWPILAPLHISKRLLQTQGWVRWFSVIYRVTEKVSKKEHQTNKGTTQTTFIYLRQSLFLKQITFCYISREMTFSFPSVFQEMQWVGRKWNKGKVRPLQRVLESSHCLSVSRHGFVSFYMSHIRCGFQPLTSRE